MAIISIMYQLPTISTQGPCSGDWECAGSYSLCSHHCYNTTQFPASHHPNNSGIIEYSAADM